MNARDLFLEGLKHFRQELFSPALKCWQATKAMQSDFPNIDLFLNICERKVDHSLDEAQEEEHSVQLIDRVREAESEFEAHFASGNQGKAESVLDLLIHERPFDKEAHRLAVKGYRQVKNFQRMLNSARMLIKIEPYRAKSYLILGRAFYELEDFTQAIEAYQKASLLVPRNFATFYNLGIAYLGAKDLENARVSLQRALEIKPDNVLVIQQLARLNERFEKLDQDIRLRVEELKKMQPYPDVLYRLGLLYLKASNLQLAYTAFEQALEKNPDFQNALYEKGKIEIELAQYSDACKTLGRVLELGRDEIYRDTQNVEAFLKSGYEEEAALELLRLLKKEPDYGSFHIELGKQYLASQEWDMAYQELSKGVALRPQYPDGHYYLGLVLEEKKELQKAREHFQEALDLNPFYIDSALHLCEILKLEGKKNEALKVLQKASSITEAGTEPAILVQKAMEDLSGED